MVAAEMAADGRPAPFSIDVDALKALAPAEQAEQLALLGALKEKMAENPLWAYMPHTGQVNFHQQSALGTPFAAIVAGNRFGKTHAGVVDNLIQILPPEYVPPWLEGFRRRPYIGNYRVRTVVVDIPNALVKVMLPKVRELIPRAALFKGDWQKAWNDRNRILTFADGSWWDFLTHDMDIDAFAGAELDRMHFDEEPPGERGKLQYDESLARLIDRDGDVRFTMTPLLGLTWVFTELTADGTPRQDEEVYVVTGSMGDNPHLGEAMRKRLEERWAEEPTKLRARMHGEFVHLEGLVFTEFEEGRHISPDRPVPRRDEMSKPDVPVFASIDPGIDHPAALVFFWVDENDVAEVFYAEKASDLIVADLAGMWESVCAANNLRPRWTTIDPAGRNRNPVTGRSVQQEFARHGVTTLAGQNDRMAGYDVVKERLRSDRLIIHASCPALIDEFKNYRWKKPRQQQVEDVGTAAAVIKKNDDLLDALRYGLMSMPTKGKRYEDTEFVDRGTQSFRDHLKRIGGRPRNERKRVGASRP